MGRNPTPREIVYKRPKVTRFLERGPGYDLVFADDQTGQRVGHAVQVIDHWSRPQGWIVVDSETGETIFGAGDSTRIGKQLENCVYLYALRLDEQAQAHAVEAADALIDDVVQRVGHEYAEVLAAFESVLRDFGASNPEQLAPTFVKRLAQAGFVWERAR